MKFTRKIINSIRDWINQPDIKDADKSLSAFYIQTISLIIIVAGFVIGVVYTMVGQFGYVILIAVDILVLTIVIALVRFRKLQFASDLFNISTLGLLTLGILSVGGIHALGSILYPVILIFASLLLSRKSFFIYSLLCIVSVGVIVYAENQKISPPYVPDPPEFYVFLTFSLMLAASALFIRFITESLQNNLSKVRLAMQEVAAQKAMLDHVGQAVIGCDADNTIVYWNQAAADLYGWKTDEALGRKYYDVIPAQLTPDMIEAIRATLLKGEVWSGEITIKKHDQSEAPLIGTIAPLRDENGKVTGWIGIGADLTARKKSEQESKRRVDEMTLLHRLGISLASGENLYSTLLALQTEIIQLIQAEAFYVAIYNQETDIVSFPIFFDEGKPYQESARLLHEKPGLTGAVIFGGKTLYLPDMTTAQVEETYHPQDTTGVELSTFLGIPLISNEHIIGMLSVQSKQVDAYSEDQIRLMENVAVHAAIALDKAQLLDRLQMELVERKRAEEKYRAIFENSIDGIFQSTPDGRFVSVNPSLARMYGYNSPEEMVQRITNIASQIYIEPELRNVVLRRLADGEKVTDFESEEYRSDGSTIWTSMNVQAIHDVDGSILYYEGTVEDITLRKEMEKKRKEAEVLYRSLVEQTSIVAYRISPDMLASSLYISPQIQTMLGYSAEEWLSDPFFWKKIVHPEDLSKVLADVEYYLSKKERSSIEYRIRNKEGDWRWVRDETVVVKDEAGDVQFVHGVFLDITTQKQAEAAILEREELYRKIIQAAGAVPYHLDHETDTFTFIGEGIQQLTGYTKEEFTHSLWDSLIEEVILFGEAAKYPFEEAVRRSRAGEFLVWRCDYRIRTRAGDIRWVASSAIEIYKAPGISGASIGLLQDITERKQAENSLIQFRKLMDESNDAFYLIDPQTSRYIDFNRSAYEKLGYSREELTQLGVIDIAEHVTNMDVWKERVALVREKGGLIFESKYRRKDGTKFPTEVSARILTYEGEEIMVANVRDITDRKQAELDREQLIRELAVKNAESETLRESFATIVGTFEFSEIVQHILDQIRRVIPYDSASVWKVEGDRQKFISGRDLSPMFLDSNIEFVNDETNSAYPILTGDVPYILNNNVQEELADFKQEPHTYVNSWLAIPLKTRGKIIGLIALDGKAKDQFNDHDARLAAIFANQVAIALENARLFTELQSELFMREKLINELELKNSELERFTYTVSHDLKSPLVTINGFLGYLKGDAVSGNTERVTLDIQRIQDAVDKMHVLLRELLEMSRIGRIMNPAEQVPFEDLVHEALEIVHGRLEAREVTVHVQSGLPAVHGDRQRLLEVLQNLIDNAAKYMGNQIAPQIEIGQRGEEDGRYIFYVKDNGMGIQSEYHERIFGLFDKLDPKSEGTGVGLALVKRIIEVHGGRIWVESEVGMGTTFYFTLAKADT